MMGERAYYLVEEPDGRFKAIYDHWGAARLREIADGGFIEEKSLWMELLEYAKEAEKRYGVDAKLTIKELYDFIDFTRIDIEAYIILWRNGKTTIFLTIISNYIYGAIRWESSSYESKYLRGAFRERDKVETIISFLRIINENDKVKSIEQIRKAWGEMKNMGYVENHLILADSMKDAVEKQITLPLRNIGGVIYY